MLKIDLHIHSINSGHAYGTIYNIFDEAKKKKMDMIAITDHGPSMEGTGSKAHFLIGTRRPQVPGLRILWGCEANVIGPNGEIDVEGIYIDRLDIVLVNFHKYTGYEDQGIEKNTVAIIKAFQNPKIKVLAHPESPQYEYDFEKVCKVAVENNVLLELNLAYLRLRGEERLEKFRRIVEISKENNRKILISSDAHFVHEIGDDSLLDQYREKLGLTDDMIINNFPDELMEFLSIK